MKFLSKNSLVLSCIRIGSQLSYLTILKIEMLSRTKINNLFMFFSRGTRTLLRLLGRLISLCQLKHMISEFYTSKPGALWLRCLRKSIKTQVMMIV